MDKKIMNMVEELKKAMMELQTIDRARTYRKVTRELEETIKGIDDTWDAYESFEGFRTFIAMSGTSRFNLTIYSKEIGEFKENVLIEEGLLFCNGRQIGHLIGHNSVRSPYFMRQLRVSHTDFIILEARCY